MLDGIGKTLKSHPTLTIKHAPSSAPSHASQAVSSALQHSTSLSLKARVLSAIEQLAIPSPEQQPDWAGVYRRTHSLLGEVAEHIHTSREDAVLLHQTPESDAPARLEMARQASDYVLGAGPNPMKGLPRQALANITFDESGNYTSAERYASYQETVYQDQAYWAVVNDKARIETEIHGGNRGHLLVTSSRQHLLANLHPAERTATAYTPASLQGELLAALRNQQQVPEPAHYPLLALHSGEAAAVVTENGKSRWSIVSLDSLARRPQESVTLSGDALVALIGEASAPRTGWVNLTLPR